jgi:hypothetical protein
MASLLCMPRIRSFLNDLCKKRLIYYDYNQLCPMSQMTKVLLKWVKKTNVKTHICSSGQKLQILYEHGTKCWWNKKKSNNKLGYNGLTLFIKVHLCLSENKKMFMLS